MPGDGSVQEKVLREPFAIDIRKRESVSHFEFEGIKQLLNCRALRFYMNRSWQAELEFRKKLPPWLEALGLSEEAQLVRKNEGVALALIYRCLEVMDERKKRVPYFCVGFENLVREMRALVVELRKKQNAALAPGGVPLSNILLYGPPGCGKTALVMQMAFESGAWLENLPSVSFYRGEDGDVGSFFETAEILGNSIVFIDEVDTAAQDRFLDADGVSISRMLNFVDESKLSPGVQVIACSNMPWKLDPAVLRTGRFSHHFYVGLPDWRDRENLLRHYLAGVLAEGLDYARLSEPDYFHTCSDVKLACRKAVRLAWTESIEAAERRPVTQRHVEAALLGARSSAAPWFEAIKGFAKSSIAREFMPQLHDEVDRYFKHKARSAASANCG